MQKRTIVYLASSAAVLASLGSYMIAVTPASAQTINKASGFNDLVNAIAQKFNLNQSDVQKVFDDQRAKENTQRDQLQTDRINQAVSDGKLTQDQANKILAKKAELKSQMPALMASLEGKTQAEKQALMKEHKDALTKWANDNNIPLQYLHFLGGEKEGRGFGGPMGHQKMMVKK